MRYLTILLLFLVVSAHASGRGDDVDIDVTGGDTTVTGGDVTVPVDVAGGDTNLNIDGDSAIALAAPGLGDVDIAQCLGSEAWTLLVGGKQKLVLNQVCMAEFYLKQGRYDLAAQSLCNQPEIMDEYESEEKCESDHDFTPLPEPITAPAQNVDVEDEDFAAEWHEEQQQLLVDLQTRLAMLEEEEERERRQIQHLQQTTQETSNQLGISEEQRSAIAEVLERTKQ